MLWSGQLEKGHLAEPFFRSVEVSRLGAPLHSSTQVLGTAG